MLSDLLDEKGLDAKSALVEASIDPHSAGNPRLRVSGTQQVAFQRAFVRRTWGHQELWTRAAVQHKLQILDLVGLAYWTAPNLDAWCRLFEFSDFHYGLAGHVLLRDDQGHYIGIESVYTSDEELREFSFVLDTASVVRGLDAVWGGEFPFEQIEYPAAMSPAPLGRRRGPRAEASDTPRLTWSSATATSPLPGANPLLHQSYVQTLRARVAALRETVAPEVRVQTYLETPGNCARPIRDTAHSLGVSVRTLQRRLEERGISYRDLQLAARRASAAHLVESTNLSIGCISDALGYSDSSSFSRAFSSWFGESPSDRRKLGRP
ncbi:helix-turn-helix domain-containing protein [Salinibacterium sp. ZJ454]|uniref:helix-turn-helix domain-containing protein n=1 Tax=Salinibacterium sp. ZJ454 TaxID=2708339 RepID=UPI0014222F60|nr:helix-turn-helix domain-containing protein [Salinibacterium sp. ZJ454]